MRTFVLSLCFVLLFVTDSVLLWSVGVVSPQWYSHAPALSLTISSPAIREAMNFLFAMEAHMIHQSLACRPAQAGIDQEAQVLEGVC